MVFKLVMAAARTWRRLNRSPLETQWAACSVALFLATAFSL